MRVIKCLLAKPDLGKINPAIPIGKDIATHVLTNVTSLLGREISLDDDRS